ncbi:MAG TPA: urea carboxylase-associated family protein [Burkholderiales bacterium]|nr:urea carboxylase-associated family protein [Burkholderiales bacterium]
MKSFVIPKREGRAFELKQGEILRLIAHEGKQVADMTALNRHDFRETFSSHLTAGLNGASLRYATKLYSRPPFFRAMLTIVDDKAKLHWIHGRCTRKWDGHKRHEGIEANCHDNIVGALKPFGVDEHQVPLDTFNAFMVVDIDADSHYTFRAPVIERGDYIEFRAEIDQLVAISACPASSEINDYAPKALKVEIRPA